ncbi:helix-turn-helix domain-containing protein [Aurantimonas sp. NFXS3]
MSVATDLFAEAPHPDFLKRLELFRSGGVSALQRTLKPAPQTPSLFPARKPTPRPRHDRPEPRGSRQYADTMSTTAARDDRLTPNAKALLQVIRARCGKGRETPTCKSTLASIMSRSRRTIARYLRDLERFGYINTEIRCTGRGLHTGLIITITDAVLAFFAETKGLARWLAETKGLDGLPFAAETPGIHRVTQLSPTNEVTKDSFLSPRKGLSKDAGRRPKPSG